ncbi:MAG: hypothetical protein JEY71_14360 [Sphaerochaeta sp.]|nr:hypothetical protein [Sphaerochaeta sp.]
MSTNKETKELCRTFSKGYDEAEKLIMDWGRDNKDLKKTIGEIMALDNNARYPQGYGGMSAGNFLVSLILTDPTAIKKLSSKHKAVLTSTAKQVLSFWQEEPAFWCYFSIKEKLKDDFLTIIDLLSGEEHLLYSKGISGMQKSSGSRGKHYLCLMLDNGECLQTAGILRYNALPVSDFMFYCALFEPEASLTEVINTHYSQFFLLDEISTLPTVMHRGNKVLYTWQPFTLDSFESADLGGEWTIKEKGNLTSYSLEEPDESMREVPKGELLFTDFPATSFTLYRDTSTGAMAINTTALASYTIIASLLTRSYPDLVLPEEPEVAISMALFSLLSRMDVDLPWSTFKTFMNLEEKAKSPETPEMEKMNKLLQAYMQAQNSGKSFDAKAFSKQSGLALDIVEGLIESLQNTFAKNMPSYEVPPIDKGFELTGLPIPPPVTKRLFSDSMGEAGIFKLDEGPNTLAAFETLTGGLYKQEIFAEGLLDFIEDLFIEICDSYDLACMLENSFFWILFYKGRDWLPVRSYAIEMLKLMPGIILQKYDEPEAFIEAFSVFTKKLLCTRGICSLKARPKAEEVKRGTYAIKGSVAFYSLVEGIKA